MTDVNKKIEDMFKAGTHYGYSKSRRHPSTAPYIFGTKNGVDIINIEKTHEVFEKLLAMVANLAQSGKTIMFVGTKSEARQQATEAALALGMPYVSDRWVGGTLTNFPEIKKRVAKLLDLRDQKEKGGLDKYTKKERLLIDREMADMTKNFQGITGMTKIPDYMIVVDPKKEHIAVTEARKMKIPVIAILNTDCNSKDVDYPIIANDASVSSISFFLSNVKEAYDKGLAGQTTEKKA
ncbi:MAG: 30S ribosomal protein S2 [Candidatus Nomurabacteria bacterium]|nr:30S ribosomal protein S2 [Candidatus Nomurabacteria bacterium]